jgi:hypothetical protein
MPFEEQGAGGTAILPQPVAATTAPTAAGSGGSSSSSKETKKSSTIEANSKRAASPKKSSGHPSTTAQTSVHSMHANDVHRPRPSTRKLSNVQPKNARTHPKEASHPKSTSLGQKGHPSPRRFDPRDTSSGHHPTQTHHSSSLLHRAEHAFRVVEHDVHRTEHVLTRGFRVLTKGERQILHNFVKDLRHPERFAKHEVRRIERDAHTAARDLNVSLNHLRKRFDRELPLVARRAEHLAVRIDRDVARAAEKTNREIAKHAGAVAAEAGMLATICDVVALSTFPPIDGVAASLAAGFTAASFAAMEIDVAEHPNDPGKALDLVVSAAIDRVGAENPNDPKAVNRARKILSIVADLEWQLIKKVAGQGSKPGTHPR